MEKLLTVTNRVFLEVQAQEQVKTNLKDENIKIFNSLDKEVDQYQLSTSTTLALFM